MADGFTFVTSSRKNKSRNSLSRGSCGKNESSSVRETSQEISVYDFEKRLANTKLEIVKYKAIGHIKTKVKEWCNKSVPPSYAEQDLSGKFDIVCYGLGNFFSSVESREQLACLQELQKLQFPGEDKCYSYDPKFTPAERCYLDQHGCSIIGKNEEGKRKIRRRTVFFLPHCGTALSNNVLWANWSRCQLNCVLVIGNRLSSLNDRIPSSKFKKTYSYMNRILPYTIESPVPVREETLAAFSDTAVMYFHQLPADDHQIWTVCDEPKYDSDDVEIIKSG